MSDRRLMSSEPGVVKPNRYPFYSPRFWNGMRFGDYCRLLGRNGFRIHPLRIPMTLLVGGCTVVNSVGALAQQALFARRIAKAQVRPPVFIIGHWRSGTTLLHELMSLDDRFTHPTTFQCFVPHHFLVSRWFLQPLLRWLLPGKRPMDNMPAGPLMPQEDEFALCSLGGPTLYYQIAFCNHGPTHLEMLDMQGANARDVERLRTDLTTFYRAISLQNDKPLVLKSPTHTGRIGHLLQWFPGAKFVHITRHPHKIFPSTMHLWKSLYHVQGFQLPRMSDQQLGSYVHDCFERMYGGFFEQEKQIPSGQLVEVSFEQLLEDPPRELANIYQTLELGDSESLQIKAAAYLSARRNYKGNISRLDDQTRQEVDRRWADYLERYGYQMQRV